MGVVRQMTFGLWFVIALTGTRAVAAGDDVGTLVRALWLVHLYGDPAAVTLENDVHLKGLLAKALGSEGVLKAEGVEGLMKPATFARLAGEDGRLEAAEIEQILAAEVPSSRKQLFPGLEAHAELLTTTFDRIAETHLAAGSKLVDWIVARYQPGQPLELIVVCTGNTRRSVFGAAMGNLAAAYYDFPEIRFHSGGTAPRAVNPRALRALGAIGFVIEPAGREAPRGEPQTPNPIYRIGWGQAPLEALEFSKTYFDPANPSSGFGALMVCGEADAACPVVKGAAVRISMPFLDPKIYDGSAYEELKYAERRDDLGRLLLGVFMQARNRLAARDGG